jgi:hypothetical protein
MVLIALKNFNIFANNFDGDNQMSEESKWHWSEGMKYAVECMKAIFVLNGASAVSILTFIGNHHVPSKSLVDALVLFAYGAGSVIFTMLFTYLAQLEYGNSEVDNIKSKNLHLKIASVFHIFAYLLVIIGVLLFIIGVHNAAQGLLATRI